MMPVYCRLEREFVERKSHDYRDFVEATVSGERAGWSDVLKNKAAIIIAPANAGKTVEMQQCALDERESGRNAAFLALRRLLTFETLFDALEGENRVSYSNWLTSNTAYLTLFVDSLDEAAASQKHHVEYLIGKLLKDFGAKRERVRWVISSRPAIVTPNFLPTLAQLLDVQYVSQEHTANAETGSQGSIRQGKAKVATAIYLCC